jgi:hypothetical protein
MEISALVGKTLLRIEGGKDDKELLFICTDSKRFKMYHEQDCFESVWLDDIVGDLKDIVGWPILSAEENSQKGDGKESSTWTFYHIRTFKGTVTLKWLGESNGYYSEDVYFKEIESNGIENIQDAQFEIID